MYGEVPEKLTEYDLKPEFHCSLKVSCKVFLWLDLMQILFMLLVMFDI